MIIIARQKNCYRLQNLFWAIIPENHREDMAYVFWTISVFTVNGLPAHASVPPMRG
jgi:hypothetical protein